MRFIFALFLSLTTVNAFVVPMSGAPSTSTSLDASRKDVLQTAFLGAAGATAATFGGLGFNQPAFAADTATTAAVGDVINRDSGVTYKIEKVGDGPVPDVGELAAVRFRAFAGTMKIDDLFDSTEPYYTRVGSGGLIKGVEEVLPLMRVGDRWTITVPGKLAFGSKGRPASAGRPRIPSDSTIVFEVEMVGLPGKEPELIDLIGD